MDFKKLGIIIEREHLNKVKKKSFLLTTFGNPIIRNMIKVIVMEGTVVKSM